MKEENAMPSRPMHKPKISASIICANWMQLEKDLKALEEHGVEYIHYDVMDGVFVEDYGLGVAMINEIRRHTRLQPDYHLMVEEPHRVLRNLTPEKEAILSIHCEASRNLHRDLVTIRKLGFRVGLVLNPATTLETIEYVMGEADVVTVMTVNPGSKGQKLIPPMLKKIEALRRLRQERSLTFQISADGNMDAQNIGMMVAAGVDIIVGGSSGLFVPGRPLGESLDQMRRLIEEGLALKRE